MELRLEECPKCKRQWNLHPGAVNYCPHMGICPMPEKITSYVYCKKCQGNVPKLCKTANQSYSIPCAYGNIRTPDRDPLLQEREKTHGSFATNAEISQKLKAIFWFYHENSLQKLEPIHREALDMIALKLSRILSGQADFKDHWRDLSGYALLASEACSK